MQTPDFSFRSSTFSQLNHFSSGRGPYSFDTPQKGMIQPDQFIPIAEESGIIVDINKWVIRESCRKNITWRERGLNPGRIAVNLTGYQLSEQNTIGL